MGGGLGMGAVCAGYGLAGCVLDTGGCLWQGQRAGQGFMERGKRGDRGSVRAGVFQRLENLPGSAIPPVLKRRAG